MGHNEGFRPQLFVLFSSNRQKIFNALVTWAFFVLFFYLALHVVDELAWRDYLQKISALPPPIGEWVVPIGSNGKYIPEITPGYLSLKKFLRFGVVGTIGIACALSILLAAKSWICQYKPCPFCAEKIKTAAIVCKHCRRDLPAE